VARSWSEPEVLLVELREPAIWDNRLLSGELEVVEASAVVGVLRSCWTLEIAVLDSSTLPEARSLRREARSFVSWVVDEVAEGSEVEETALALLFVEEALVNSARRVVSIWERDEGETAERDMGESFGGLKRMGYNDWPIGRCRQILGKL
jgi:hypothetical protein